MTFYFSLNPIVTQQVLVESIQFTAIGRCLLLSCFSIYIPFSIKDGRISKYMAPQSPSRIEPILGGLGFTGGRDKN